MDNAGFAEVAFDIERAAVDRADGPQLVGTKEAFRAEGVAARLGGYGGVEGGATDGAFEAFVDFGFVLKFLVVDEEHRGPTSEVPCGAHACALCFRTNRGRY